MSSCSGSHSGNLDSTMNDAASDNEGVHNVPYNVKATLCTLEKVLAEELQIKPAATRQRGQKGGLTRIERSDRQQALLDNSEAAQAAMQSDPSASSGPQVSHKRLRGKTDAHEYATVLIQPVGLQILLRDLQRLMQVLAIHLGRDNVLLHGGTLPRWAAMPLEDLRLWYLCSLRLCWPEDSTLHWNKWYYFFHVHAADRETQQLWKEVLVPWALKARAPVFVLWLAAMLRRFFHSPRSWAPIWLFIQTRVVAGTYVPLRDSKKAFLEASTGATP